MKNYSDKKLIKEYLKGNTEAIEIFYKRYEKMLFKYIYRRVFDKETVEDLFQEIWMKFFYSLKSIKFFTNIKSLLFRIAHNHIIDYYKKKKKYTVSFEQPIKEDFLLEDVLYDTSVKKADDKIFAEELKEELNAALDKLTDEQREVFLLRYEQELKFKEIAQVVNAPLNTVLGRMRQALIKISNHLTQKGYKSMEDIK